MTEAHIRSILIGAMSLIGPMRSLGRANAHPQLFFSHSEIRAFQGFPRSDASWFCEEDPSLSISHERARLFMEKTHEYATIMVSMIEKLKTLGMPTGGEQVWEYNDEGLYFYFDRDELNALKGDPLPSGEWRDSNPIRGSISGYKTISSKSAERFFQKTRFASKVMVQMIGRLRDAGILEDLIQAESISQPYSNLNNRSADEQTVSFRPSVGAIPIGVSPSGNDYQLLLSCLGNQSEGIQSFFGDLAVASPLDVWGNEIALSDDVLNIQPFDEDLYCRIIRDNHRYRLAELAARQEEIASQYMIYGGLAGALLGIITHNPVLPFVGMSLGRSLAPRGNTLQEILPDPYLLFRQDNRSYLSIIAGGTPSARLRRIIFHPQASPSGVFFRALPAFVTHESVMPMQLFSFNDTYFYRPIAAGIEASQANYNAAKLWRKYFHLRGDGSSVDTGFKLSVTGVEIDDHKYKLFKFKSESRDLQYFYIDYQAEPSHVF